MVFKGRLNNSFPRIRGGWEGKKAFFIFCFFVLINNDIFAPLFRRNKNDEKRSASKKL